MAVRQLQSSTTRLASKPSSTTVKRSPVWRVDRDRGALQLSQQRRSSIRPAARRDDYTTPPNGIHDAKYFNPTDPDNDHFNPTITIESRHDASRHAARRRHRHDRDRSSSRANPTSSAAFYFTTDNSTRETNKRVENYLRVKDPDERSAPARQQWHAVLSWPRTDLTRRSTTSRSRRSCRAATALVGAAGAQYTGHDRWPSQPLKTGLTGSGGSHALRYCDHGQPAV